VKNIKIKDKHCCDIKMILQHAYTAQLLMLYLNFFYYLDSASAFLSSPVDIHNVFHYLDSLDELRNNLHIGDNQIQQDFVSKSFEIKDTLAADAHSLYAAIRKATVTKRVNNALAGILAEFTAGSVGALLSTKASITMIDGKKRDSSKSDIFLVCLGIPRPFTLLLAALVGAAVSTSVKSEGRIADQVVVKEAEVRRGYYCSGGEFIVNLDVPTINTAADSPPLRSLRTRSIFEEESSASSIKTGNIIDYCPAFYTTDNHMLETEKYNFSEVAGDICKWMVFDSLVSNSLMITLTGIEITSLHMLYGAIAAVAGKCLEDLTPLTLPKDNKPIKYSQIAAEGAVLFGTYKGTLTLLNCVLPDNWNKAFLFESVLEKMEETIK
jgi:hypothetical protein